MKLNNVNKINHVGNIQTSRTNSEDKHDNEYVGEKVTMDTPNPGEVLGRSLVTQKNSTENDLNSIEQTHINKQDTVPKTGIARSYLGKTKLVIKNINDRIKKTFAPGLESQMTNEETAAAKSQIEDLKQEMLESPDSFVDCTNDAKEKQELIENFFNGKSTAKYYYSQKSLLEKTIEFFGPDEIDEKELSLITAIHILGKDAVKTLLNEGITVAEYTLSRINELRKSKLSFLKSYLDKTGVDNKPLLPKEKLELIDLFLYQDVRSKKPIKMFENNLVDGKVDIQKLRKDFVQNFNLAKSVKDIAQKLAEEKTNVYDFNKLLSFLNTLESIQYGGEFLIRTSDAIKDILKDKEETFRCVDEVTKLSEIVSKHSEKYVNGEHTKDVSQGKAELFLAHYPSSMFLATHILGKEATDVLLRKRLNFAEDFFRNKFLCSNIDKNQIKMIKDLANSKNVEGKSFSPTEKIDFIYLVEVYRKNKISFEKMQQMVNEGKVDVLELKTDVFKQILKNAGMKDSEISQIPQDKMLSWNIEYIHLLSEVAKYDSYMDILRAANLEDFETYIHDKSNDYGKANSKTKQMFEENGMNYDKWIHPSKEHEINFASKNEKSEQLVQITDSIAKEMNILMATPAKGHIKKQFPDCIKGDEFIIPAKYSASKAELGKFIKLLTDDAHSKMNAVWDRAKGNLKSDNTDRVLTAQNNLTILYHLKQSAEAVEKISDSKEEQPLNWKIKMWDRIPQKDLFQGNYSQCCIGVGSINGEAMPHYMMDTAFNMIEIVDNDIGETIGNGLCYFVKTKDGKPALAIDNIEIANRFIPSGKVGKAFRDSLVKYAATIAKEVTGSDDVPIFLGKRFNDMPDSDLPINIKHISFLGEIDDNSAYLDMYNGWTSKRGLKGTYAIYRLK